ncbi:MAG: dihydropteroate synthase [Phycisphaerae bacterium]|nr:dihydropteroate synthase [Phycisphaerae bacterium]
MMISRADYFLTHRLTAPVIMGVINATPDSFSDAGQFQTSTGINHAAAVEYALDLARQGAVILDIGGEASSFHRPGIGPVVPEEQIRRVLPIIEAIARRRDAAEGVLPALLTPPPKGLRPPGDFSIVHSATSTSGHTPPSSQSASSDPGHSPLISIDTRSSVVAAAALRAGADIINDISAGTDDPEMFPLAAGMNCPLILMHRREERPGQGPPAYANVCAEVVDYLQQRSQDALAAGLQPHRILLDPGLGFGKSPADNWKLLAGIGELASLGFPVVLGASRKRFLSDLLPSHQLQAGLDGWLARDILTSEITVLAAARGVRIHRVHQVPLARQALEVFARMTVTEQDH